MANEQKKAASGVTSTRRRRGDDDGGNVIYSDDTPEQTRRQALRLSRKLDTAVFRFEEAKEEYASLQSRANQARARMFAALGKLQILQQMIPGGRQ